MRGGKARRWLVAAFGCACTAGVLVACTFTQSLDYLQKGGALIDVVSEDLAVDGGGDAGARMPSVLVPNQTKPEYLAQDAKSLYWIAGGSVMSVPKSGGTPKALGAVPPNASALVAEPDPAGAVFVVVGTSVVRVPKDGTDGGVVFTPAAADPPTSTIAASASSLYVLQYDESLAVEGSRILRMAKDGGGATDIAPDSGPSTLDLDSKSVFWVGSDPDKPGMVEQLESAAPGTVTAVYAFSVNDDQPTTSSDIAVDDGFLYWLATDATSGAAKIVSRRRDPAASVVTVVRGGADDTFSYLRLDATHVYFIETRTSSLLRVPKSGGDVERLLVGLAAPSGLVVDDTAIYVTVEATGSTGQVLALTK
jgi:hypothetical protein